MSSHAIATLIYCFNHADEVLLLERLNEPNRGLWSPIGGKVDVNSGESPYHSACREAQEEIGAVVAVENLHLAGIVSEKGDKENWLMFLFELKTKLAEVPNPHREGRFSFFTREELANLPIPATDREMIWPLFWKHRGGFFSAHCDLTVSAEERWSLEESRAGKD